MATGSGALVVGTVRWTVVARDFAELVGRAIAIAVAVGLLLTAAAAALPAPVADGQDARPTAAHGGEADSGGPGR